MKRTSNPHAAEQLAQLAAQFDQWRRARASRAERIPPPLWQHAVALTTELSVSQVAKGVRVSCRDLRKQCAAAQAPPVDAPAPAPLHFVEIPPVSPWPLSPSATTIELVRADGTRLQMHTRECPLPLVAVIRAFLEASPCSS
jgi:hypothetical protein